MTPEELEELVLGTYPSKNFVAAFSKLTEAERKKLSTSATSLRDQIYRGKANKTASPKLKAFITSRKELWDREFNTAVLAVFAVGPISQIKKRRIFLADFAKVALTNIILDRKPDWLDEWVTYELEQEFTWLIDFEVLRAWIKAGICKKPDVDGYTQMFAQHLMSTGFYERQKEKNILPISKQLLAEPDLLDDIWGLFKVETNAFNTNSWFIKGAAKDYETWTGALLKLSQNGSIDRRKLLNASLEGLQGDVKQNQLSGYWKFHNNLAPTKEERAAIQAGYLALLCHPVGHVVKFGLSMANQLEKDKVLDTQTFLSEVRAVFFLEAKGNAVTALKLIKRILKNEPQFSGLALRTTAEALRHQNADVGSLAVDILDAHKSNLDEDLKYELGNVADYVAASVKNRVLVLAGQSTETETCTAETLSAPEFEEALSALTPSQRNALRIDDILKSKTSPYLPINDDIMAQAILPNQEPLTPIADLDELISAILHAVETIETPDEVERILDGLSKFGAQIPPDFNERVDPLRQRLKKMQFTYEGDVAREGLTYPHGGVRYAMYVLLQTWMNRKYENSKNSPYFSPSKALKPAITRIRCIAKSILANEAHPLLSFPTHTGGWIDPLIWIERIISSEKNNYNFSSIDVCLSLLRLSPDNRTVALERAHTLSEKFKRLAIFALGGDAYIRKTDRKSYAEWISASRARNAFADWSEVFTPMNLTDTLAGSIKPTQIDWKSRTIERKGYYNNTYTARVFRINIYTQEQEETSLGRKVSNFFKTKITTDWTKIPTAALHRNIPPKPYEYCDLTTNWVARWLCYQWPLCTNAANMIGSQNLVFRLDDNASSGSPGSGFFYGLFQKKRPWGEAGHLLLGMGLIGKDADTRGLTIDAFIEGVESGVLDVALLANTLVRLCAGEWVKLNRLGDVLMQISQISDLHAWAVSECIQLWLPHVDIKQRNIFKILEVLLEAQSMTRQPLNDLTKQALKEFKGSSKAAKTARTLLKLSDNDINTNEQIKRMAILSRL